MDETKLSNISAAVKAQARRMAGLSPSTGGPDKISDLDRAEISRFVLDCQAANEVGDGLLYAWLHKSKFCYDKTDLRWRVYDGHTWRWDDYDDHLSAVEAVAQLYDAEADRLAGLQANEKTASEFVKQQVKDVRRSAKRLRSVRGRRACVECAHTHPTLSLGVLGSQFDRDPNLLGVENGVVNLVTGELAPGEPDQYISKHCPVAYKGVDEPAPHWEQALNEIFAGDGQTVGFLRRALGYALFGRVTEHVVIILSGRGRNGKGTIVETVRRILGGYAVTIPPEMLLDAGWSKSSSGPSPDIMALRGRRLALASEVDEGRRFSTAVVKRLTGGDTQTARNAYDPRMIEFEPSHTLFLQLNHTPRVSQDYAFWERVRLVEFPISFVDASRGRELQEFERPRDAGLMGRLAEESSGILSWLVRGCLEWRRDGLAARGAVAQATQNYRRGEDLIQDWIDERCVLGGNIHTALKTLHDDFSLWWGEVFPRGRAWSRQKMGKALTAKGFDSFKNSVMYYKGLGLLAASD